MPDKHLTYGGSTMARTLGCPAWVKLSALMPPQQSTSFADEGTMLHNCMEKVYDNNIDVDIETLPSNAADCKFGDAELTFELYMEKIRPAYDAVEDILDEYNVHDDDIYVEPFVELIPDEAGGSIDMLAFSDDGKTAIVIDYKFGFHPVSAEENKQQLFYALCSAVDPQFENRFRKVENLELAIIQPNDQGDVASRWQTPAETLDDFEDKVYLAIDDTQVEDPQPCAGDWCQYCPAASLCPAKTGEAQRALRLNIQQADDLAEALSVVEAVEKWANEVRKVAHEQLENGVKIPGFKLVAKRATRKWVNEEEATEKAKKNRKLKKDEIFKTTFLSPAQFEKVCKKNNVDFDAYSDYIDSVSSGTTIAHESDSRPEALPHAALEELGKRL